MTGRDRIVLIVVVVAAVLGAGWILAVSPERKKANELSTQVAAAQTQLASAESKVSSARAAQSQYAAAYASIVNLGKAVPPSEEVPALIYQLQAASNEKDVHFSSISASSSGATASPSGASASSSAASGASASGSAASSTANASLTRLPFSFGFEGSYFDLEHLFNQLSDFATLTASGQLEVSGRLLTIQSVSLSPAGGPESGKSSSQLTGSITATAYVLPASQGLTGATSPSSANGATTSPASSATAASSPTSPAIVTAHP
jgi:Tfp pilus assembly protein PilO